MENKTINLFHFGDVGAYDEYNPKYIHDIEGASEIIYAISSIDPYSMNVDIISDKLSINQEKCTTILNDMEKINMVSSTSGKYKVDFPIFLENDMNIIQRYVKDVAKKIGNRIIGLQEEILKRVNYISCIDEYGKDRILYHLIGDFTFDGIALEYLSDRDMFSVYKKQTADRNYILIGYENNKRILKYSDELLCSTQNYSVGRFKFNSFGDCDGERKDFYRFFTNVSRCLGTESNNKELMSSYIKLNDIYNDNTVKKCGELILLILEDEIYVEDLSGEERYLIDIMRECGYINIEADNRILCTVPVINENDIEIFRDISYVILENIYEEIDMVFNSIKEELKDIMAVKHEVSIKEVCNEIWHQIFGSTNEYLIEKEFIAEPKYRVNEGRYFQCIYIHN